MSAEEVAAQIQAAVDQILQSLLPSGGPVARTAKAVTGAVVTTSAAVVVPVSKGAASVAPAAAAVAIASTAATAAAAATGTPGGLLAITQSFLPFLGLVRRRRPPLGRVVEDKTGLPVADVSLSFRDARGTVLETTRSRSDGTFAVLLQKGTYALGVERDGYELAREARAAIFPGEELYRGGPITVTSEEKVAPLVVVMKSLAGRVSPSPVWRWLRGLSDRLRIAQARYAVWLLIGGAVVNSLALLRQPSLLLIGFELLYGVFLTLELLLSWKVQRAVGRVRDVQTKDPVSGAAVRLVDVRTQQAVATRVSSPLGHVLLMPAPGLYDLQVAHAAYRPFVLEGVHVRKGAVGSVRLRADLEPKSRARAAV